MTHYAWDCQKQPYVKFESEYENDISGKYA